ncbi:MAG TPA: carboxypeptidase-like regulatory domain-containing protein [Vicinamibacterales bacterium]|nr:carboxypeptidase-like regulatory domain-containing protein [Vicinamibacterales bacterium]
MRVLVHLAAVAVGVAFLSVPGGVVQTQGATGAITGVVQGPKGPEAGVWVIAETRELPTNFIKIVVTDDQGRFVIPELPAAGYSVWVRGYGLVDSSKTTVKPGATGVTLRATAAATPQEAAKVYPGNYWLSLMAPPAATSFPGTGNQGNGFGPTMVTQNHWINTLKSGCNFCHQLGNQLTRSLDHVYKGDPSVKTTTEAWDRRLKGGVRGGAMYGTLGTMGAPGTLGVLGDWSDRIAKGEVPPAPPRPRGIERNVVVTLWDVGDDHSFMHDEISTDKNHPTVNGGGSVYAVNAGHGQLVVLNPKENSTYAMDIPTRAPRDQVPSRFPAPTTPSLHWGNEHLWANPPYNPADPHNPMMDSKGRVWTTSKIRGAEQPAWCNDAKLGNRFADWFPLQRSGRQASYYDPKTAKWQLIETCYATHHLQFDNDANETVYFNELSGPIFGWIDTKLYDETLAKTKNEITAEQTAVGWCGQVVDTNGDGKITRPWTVQAGRGATVEAVLYQGDTGGGRGAAPAGGGRGAPAQSTGAGGPSASMDTMVSFSMYSVIPSPVDDSVWGISETYPGILVRLQRGNNPPSTCKSQIFRVPAPGFDPRGVDIDSNGVVWTALAASSHLASFDVRKCKDLGGPQKTDGSQCQEGWTLYQTDGPKLKGTDVPADFHYYNWVDQHNISGLGANTPFATGSNSDALLALNPQTRQWVTLRVPYPLGFYSRGMDGRIDDPKAGWKGRGLWANYGTHFVWHIEGGKGTKGKMVKFQIRPDPLAQ